jgi:hypothetical protein
MTQKSNRGEPLRTAVGADPPQELVEALDADQIAKLSAQVAEARAKQREAMARAGEEALRHVPKLLRGPLQRMLG